MELFKKSSVIGVSINPEVGLEVAEIDFVSKTILKYACRPIEYNHAQKDVADIDILKESLQDMFVEMEIPKGAEVVLNIPTLVFNIKDYPAALDSVQLDGVIEDDLSTNPNFQDMEPCYSKAILPNSTIQSNKVAYIASQKNTIYELCLIIKEMGVKILAIDTSVNTTVNALRYLERVNSEHNSNWVLMLVEQTCCRVLLMIGSNYSDVFEEKISIGDVLGEEENYETVIAAVAPILKNIPAKYLCVVSKTSVISAEKLANKITYSAPVTYQEANSYLSEPFLQCAPTVNEEYACNISLDIIGASIYRDFLPYSSAKLNLFNKSLGDIYMMEQPPEIKVNNRIISLSTDFLIKAFIVILVIILIPSTVTMILVGISKARDQKELNKLNAEIQEADEFLRENNNISAEMFDEGDQIRTGLEHNRSIYYYYTIVGTEIPKKLWLTHLKLDDKVTIEGQADNLESVYGFFRNIKDYNSDSGIKLQKLGLASSARSKIDSYDTESMLSSLNADFYEFRISNEEEIPLLKDNSNEADNLDQDNTAGKNKQKKER